MDFYDKIKSIDSQEDFVIFLKLLKNNFGENKNDWENSSLESFLDGMIGYCSDKKFDEFAWKDFGEILLASRVYE